MYLLIFNRNNYNSIKQLINELDFFLFILRKKQQQKKLSLNNKINFKYIKLFNFIIKQQNKCFKIEIIQFIYVFILEVLILL